MIFKEHDRFKKDLKKLEKKYITLKSDLDILKIAIEAFHLEENGQEILKNIIVKCEGLQNQELKNKIFIYKIRRIKCRYLKNLGGNNGLRIIYAYFKELEEIEFLQFYYKGDRENEDRDMIDGYLKEKENDINNK